jgi:hypothetical protein
MGDRKVGGCLAIIVFDFRVGPTLKQRFGSLAIIHDRRGHECGYTSLRAIDFEGLIGTALRTVYM